MEAAFQQQPHHTDRNAEAHQRHSEATSQIRMLPTDPKTDQQARKQLKQEPQDALRKTTSKT
jgi:hypothetical protein